MKNNFIIIFISLLISSISFAENLKIESKNITLDKNKEVTIFENEVFMENEDNNTIKSDYAEHNKSTNLIILKNNIIAIDKKNNRIESDYAEYNELSKIFNMPTDVLLDLDKDIEVVLEAAVDGKIKDKATLRINVPQNN